MSQNHNSGIIQIDANPGNTMMTEKHHYDKLKKEDVEVKFYVLFLFRLF